MTSYADMKIFYLPGGSGRSLDSEIGVNDDEAGGVGCDAGGLGLMGVLLSEAPLLECKAAVVGRSRSGPLLRCTAAFNADKGEGRSKIESLL